VRWEQEIFLVPGVPDTSTAAWVWHPSVHASSLFPPWSLSPMPVCICHEQGVQLCSKKNSFHQRLNPNLGLGCNHEFTINTHFLGKTIQSISDWIQNMQSPSCKHAAVRASIPQCESWLGSHVQFEYNSRDVTLTPPFRGFCARAPESKTRFGMWPWDKHSMDEVLYHSCSWMDYSWNMTITQSITHKFQFFCIFRVSHSVPKCCIS